MTITYSSPKMAKETSKKYGNRAKTVQVDMKYGQEIGTFIRELEKAKQDTVHSTLQFK